MKNIKYLVMDVDGTLTDGKIYIGDKGECFKAYNIKDGCGIKDILPYYNIIPVIITGRKSKSVENRCNELNVSCYYQGERNKLKKLNELIAEHNMVNCTNFSLENCAYIGDDINDLECMTKIKSEGGIIGAPKDAIKPIIEMSSFVSVNGGGQGAVRDFIEWIIENKYCG